MSSSEEFFEGILATYQKKRRSITDLSRCENWPLVPFTTQEAAERWGITRGRAIDRLKSDPSVVLVGTTPGSIYMKIWERVVF